MKFQLSGYREATRALISRVPTALWKFELEQASSKYHVTASWIAILFDPVFAITDYINVPNRWQELFVIRLGVSLITYLGLVGRRKFNWPSYVIALIPFVLLVLQNAYTYRLIGNDNLLGHNLNFMALFIGASLFVLWELRYSVAMIIMATVVTAYFVYTNPALNVSDFFLRGGLLLVVSAIFMGVLVRTRYVLTVKEIKARLALQASNKEILAQDEQIKSINENLETLVRERTLDLEKKNKALAETAFVNAHSLRGPVASILGLVFLLEKSALDEEVKEVITRLKASTEKLDATIGSIKETIERAEQ